MTDIVTNPRTLLFVPGNQRRMLQKAAGFDIGWLIPDLEDSVPLAEKLEARRIVSEQLPALAKAGKRLVPRVNPIPSGLTEADISSVVSSHIAGVSIGKVGSAEDIDTIDSLLSAAEKKAGLPNGQIMILPWIETAEAVINAHSICKSSKRIQWAAFGAEDFSADMGISRSVDETAHHIAEPGSEIGLAYPRSAVAVAARAAGVHVLDTPYTKFRDIEGLKTEARLAKSIGYKGKLAIHPAQVEIIESVFKPSETEIHRAREVLKIAAEAENEGRGSVSLNGEMIDMPVILRARNIMRDAGLN